MQVDAGLVFSLAFAFTGGCKEADHRGSCADHKTLMCSDGELASSCGARSGDFQVKATCQSRGYIEVTNGGKQLRIPAVAKSASAADLVGRWTELGTLEYWIEEG